MTLKLEKMGPCLLPTTFGKTPSSLISLSTSPLTFSKGCGDITENNSKVWSDIQSEKCIHIVITHVLFTCY